MKTLRMICAGMVILLTVTFNVRAQQYDTPPTNNEVQDQNTRNDMDDPNSPQYKYAVSMSKDIMNKLSLSFEQAEKIRDILLDYQQDVLDIKSRYVNNRTDNDNTAAGRNDGTGAAGNTGTGTSGMNDNTALPGDRAATDRTDDNITNNENGEMVGGNATDKMEAYQDADIDANDKIEDALEENQVAKYNEIKKDWWASIKQHVHSQEAFNEIHNMNKDKTGKNNNKDMDNTRTGSGNTKGTD